MIMECDVCGKEVGQSSGECLIEISHTSTTTINSITKYMIKLVLCASL